MADESELLDSISSGNNIPQVTDPSSHTQDSDPMTSSIEEVENGAPRVLAEEQVPAEETAAVSTANDGEGMESEAEAATVEAVKPLPSDATPADVTASPEAPAPAVAGSMGEDGPAESELVAEMPLSEEDTVVATVSETPAAPAPSQLQIVAAEDPVPDVPQIPELPPPIRLQVEPLRERLRQCAFDSDACEALFAATERLEVQHARILFEEILGMYPTAARIWRFANGLPIGSFTVVTYLFVFSDLEHPLMHPQPAIGVVTTDLTDLVLEGWCTFFPNSKTLPVLKSVLVRSARTYLQKEINWSQERDEEHIKHVFSRCLLNCKHIDLWSCYLKYIQIINDGSTQEGCKAIRE
eukprot:gene25673-31394_t